MEYSKITYLVLGQISPFGVLLKSIFPDGIVLKDFSAGDCFARKMHACSKQTASETGEFALHEQITGNNGDTAMHRKPPV